MFYTTQCEKVQLRVSCRLFYVDSVCLYVVLVWYIYVWFICFCVVLGQNLKSRVLECFARESTLVHCLVSSQPGSCALCRKSEFINQRQGGAAHIRPFARI